MDERDLNGFINFLEKGGNTLSPLMGQQISKDIDELIRYLGDNYEEGLSPEYQRSLMADFASQRKPSRMMTEEESLKTLDFLDDFSKKVVTGYEEGPAKYK